MNTYVVRQVVIITILFSCIIPMVPADGVFTVVQTWGNAGSTNGSMANASGIAVDSNGSVYVADTGNNRIEKFTGNGTYIVSWGGSGTNTSMFSSPAGIATDTSGNVYVADTGNNRIQKFTQSGSFISVWGTYGTNTSELCSPAGVATDVGGNVYVADTGNNRIQKFTQSGNFTTAWGEYGTTPGRFNSPTGIAVDAEGYVHVADRYNSRVQKFDAAGNYICSLITEEGVSLGNLQGLASDAASHVYVTDTSRNQVHLFNATGVLNATWGGYGTATGFFNNPKGVATDSNGSVYVLDTGNSRVQVFQRGPAITSCTPASGDQSGNVTITITGTNFEANMSTVSVSGTGISVGPYSTRTGTLITCLFSISSHAATGQRIVTVTNPGTNTTANTTFTVTGPTIATLNPAFGHSNTTLPVTIAGDLFIPSSATLQKGDYVITANTSSLKKSTSTLVYIAIPLTGARTGVYNLTLKNQDGKTVTKYDAFTVLANTTPVTNTTVRHRSS
ncbi:MAG: IPT/TIG domain-containing protein [Methanospirillum sp.]|uniref:IPT/TIG domain-containing protein n=1 Tax=Methanospirillum sp. TaxID=45200 RepID=UPI002372663A|nr:IPT/TIG domain-containing protein [Methanospirillum sp.]MDD1729269.1 IPT/TIG domain-containing protein [Methanospirillum sp.]